MNLQTYEDISYKSLKEETPLVLDDKEALQKFDVSLENYEGHFDALLDMIEAKKVDIIAVCLAEVTKQYLEYISLLSKIDIGYASEFLAVAAYLMELKSKNILPKEELDEEAAEIETSLIDHLSHYKIFKSSAQVLKERRAEFSKVYHRYKIETMREETQNYFLSDVSVVDLVSIFRKVWADAKDRKDGIEIVDEIVTVEEKIEEIKSNLVLNKSGVPFEALFRTKTRLEVIVTFLAVLELIRQKLMSIKQDAVFGSIILLPTGV